MDGKSVFSSKTMWANAVAGVALLASAAGVDLGLTPEVQTTLVGGVMVIVNLVLRLVTNGPVTL